MMEENHKNADEKVLLEEELRFVESEDKQKQVKIDELNQKIKDLLTDAQAIEEKYLKVLEKT